MTPDKSSESETDRNGFLSYAAEWHSFAHGVYNGMKSWRVRPKDIPDYEDVLAEPHYFKGGYVIGTLLQALIVLIVAVVGVL